MEKEELLATLKEDYTLRSSLQRKGLTVQTEIQEEIAALEKQFIAEYVMPSLKEKAIELLSPLKCEVCVSINRDVNGDVSIDDELNVDIQPWKVQEPPVDDAQDNTTTNEDAVDTEAKQDVVDERHITRGARKKFKVILNGKEVPGDDGATILANTIRLVGFRRVASMNIMFANGEYNLVDRRRRTDKNQVWQRQIDDWYIYTNMQNPMKVRVLREIAEKQRLNLQVIEE